MTQYRLTLTPRGPCRPRAEWGYRMYAALLEPAAQDFARVLHQEGPTPLSQYLEPGPGGLTWAVTLLGEESHRGLAEVLERQDQFFLRKDRLILDVTGRGMRSVPDVDALLARGAACGPLHRLRFCTPTAFKSRGRYICLPTSRLIVQSLIKKWNASFPDCLIEDEDFRLQSRAYRVKGYIVPGFEGELTAANRLTGFQRQLAGALLLFSSYAGVGIKTTLGMGGVAHELV